MHILPIDHCLLCYRTCLETALHHCLVEGNKHTEPEHFRLLLDCAEICRVCADFMIKGSGHQRTICLACAEICDACAASCAEFTDNGTMECAHVCRSCAHTCRALVVDMRTTTWPPRIEHQVRATEEHPVD